jgi:hypothetical protein
LSLDLNGYIANAFIISLSAFLFFGALCGSYIEVTGDQLIRLEGYSKKRFLLGKIAKIYCAPHIFLGPSMFFNYKEESAIFGKEKKLLVLNQYRDKDKKALLYFLNEKFPKIQQDENCEKIRNGEKILTKR